MKRNYPLQLVVEHKDGVVEKKTVSVAVLASARHTGRDRAAVRREMDDLARQGRLMPATNPAICKESRYLLTTDGEIEVQGARTSGEAEFVVIVDGNELLVTVGSDHCDRTVETIWQDKPKQMCPKVIAPRAWRYDDVRSHWDDLVLRSWVSKNGDRILFQESSVAAQCAIEDLFESDPHIRVPGLVMLGGTPPYRCSPIFEERFEMELSDPVLGRSIQHEYRVYPLSNDE